MEMVESLISRDRKPHNLQLSSFDGVLVHG